MIASGWKRVKRQVLEHVILGVHAVLAKDPISTMLLLLLLIPFSRHPKIDIYLLPIHGAKPFILFALYLVLVAVYNSKNSIKMPKEARRLALVLLVVFTVSTFRSIYSPVIQLVGDEEEFSNTRYIFSFYLKDLVFFLPFVIILKYVKHYDQLERVINTIIFSIALMSCYLIYMYIFSVENKSDFATVRYYLGDRLSIHGNDLANFYIVVFPVFLARYFAKKDPLSIASISLMVVAIGILYSRTAYLTTLFSLVIYTILTKRSRYILVFGLLGYVLLRFVSLDIVVDRATTGLGVNGITDIYQFSAGRVTTIWSPLINEYFGDARKLIWGSGRFGIMLSDAYQTGAMYRSYHAHNIYLQLVVESGIVGFLAVIVSFLCVVFKSVKKAVGIKDPVLRGYQIGFLVSIIAFLVSGVSGRSFFPGIGNSYLWTVLACAVVLPHFEQERERG